MFQYYAGMSRLDSKICTLLGKREPKGMELLFGEYYRPLVLWADTFLNDIDRSEDLIQDFFVKIWEQTSGKKLLPGTLKAYLFTAVHNLALNEVRNDHRCRRMADYEQVNLVWEEYDDFQNDIMVRAHRAVEALPPRSREVVTAVYLGGLRYREVAEKLGISVATVKTLLVHSMRVLRENLRNAPSLLLFFFLDKKKNL